MASSLKWCDFVFDELMWQYVASAAVCNGESAGRCIGSRIAEISHEVYQKRRQGTIRCDADSNASASTSRLPRELLMPVSQLVEARVIFVAAPAMGHNQVSSACSFLCHLDKSYPRLFFYKNKVSNQHVVREWALASAYFRILLRLKSSTLYLVGHWKAGEFCDNVWKGREIDLGRWSYKTLCFPPRTNVFFRIKWKIGILGLWRLYNLFWPYRSRVNCMHEVWLFSLAVAFDRL